MCAGDSFCRCHIDEESKPASRPKSSRIAAQKKRMKTFRLVRNEDISGVSGTGVVAEGVEFVNGMVALSWFGSHSCVNTYTSMRTVVEIHGHEGATKVEWTDA